MEWRDRRVEGPNGGGPEGWGPKFSPAPIFAFFSLSGGCLVKLWPRVVPWTTQIARLGSPGVTWGSRAPTLLAPTIRTSLPILGDPHPAGAPTQKNVIIITTMITNKIGKIITIVIAISNTVVLKGKYEQNIFEKNVKNTHSTTHPH